MIISIVIIFIMVFGFTLAGIVVNSPTGTSSTGQPSLSYKGHDFETKGGFYVTEIDGKERQFAFLPASTTTLTVPDDAMQALKNAPFLTITFNPNSSSVQNAEVARFQFSRNLDKTVVPAVTYNSSQYNLPVMTCKNATQLRPIVYLNGSNTTSIQYNNGCVVLSGSGSDLLRATERLIYGLLGVVE